MRHYVAYEQHSPAEVDLRDEPVVVPSNVEDDIRRNEVCRVEGLFLLDMFLAKDSNCVTDHVHWCRLDGPMTGPARQ